MISAAVLAFSMSLSAQDQNQVSRSPGQIINESPQGDWVRIPSEDLLIMTIGLPKEETKRQVVIQLMPPPFSEGWTHNIRLLAREGWYEGTSINRVQDNYVVQWGDPNYDNPESEGQPKPLPPGLRVMEESEYVTPDVRDLSEERLTKGIYAPATGHYLGWPVGVNQSDVWPVHCYAMVGVGRNYSPDTGSGAELYAVIGHAPRHLDRNIALVGRVISGIENLSSLPRGSGILGFYSSDEVSKRTVVLSMQVATDLPEVEQPKFEYLDTESVAFADYAEARANRRDPFFISPAGGADICNIPVPIRAIGAE